MTDKYKALRVALELGPTKGPWAVSDDHGKRWIETLNDDDSIFQVIRRNKQVGQHRDIEFIANTNLIAACDPDTIRNLLAERDQLLQACETALSYVEAVCFNTPNDKKRRNYADCAAKIRAAMGEEEGEPL